MSRAAVIDTLIADTDLNALGIDADTILQASGIEDRPSNTGPFALIRWEDESGYVFGRVRPARRLVVWVHYPAEVTNDYAKIDAILDKVEDVLIGMEHVAGTDGQIVTCVRYTGRSSDLKDEGLQTYTRWSAFEVLSRQES